MLKKTSLTTKEELQQLLLRIRHENEALQHLINALKEQTKSIDKEILNKLNK